MKANRLRSPKDEPPCQPVPVEYLKTVEALLMNATGTMQFLQDLTAKLKASADRLQKAVNDNKQLGG